MELRTHAFSPDRVLGPVPLASKPANEDVYVFDVTALKTSISGALETAFTDRLTEWARRKPCYLVSSRGYHHIVRAIPRAVRCGMMAIYAQGGADVWYDDVCQARTTFTFDEDIFAFVTDAMRRSAFPEKRLSLLEAGPGTLSLDLAGHGASSGQRERYLTWNRQTREISRFVRDFSERFPSYRVFWEDATRLVIAHPDNCSSAVIKHLRTVHPKGRLLSYFSPASTLGYAAGFSEALSADDVLAHVDGTADISQLLAYEARRQERTSIMSFPYPGQAGRRVNGKGN